ncbi:hypothetical protein KY290_003398 [Solanum tuberosum]|uniref:NADH-ubiquinone oxidoreductase 21kDa subunit N-terminal domain-containing protein n=1 Tax=Solanum tuberosum TaxID=4113 RepID=A0ABQ7WTC5_SOLTU|nr:hypothetical protein KY285_025076 [Solanum tuberosum]KAH0733531.1 hypothetical protein KY289_004719 [Solanum tuberosum]KAH0783800.1 hypothetical protein KY290_003398 [Solanum tuberosum]
MNTDITASAKPEYPVVDRNPPFTKTVGNFNTLDYLRLTTITGISVTVGYLSGIKPGIRGPSMVTGGLIGLMGGFMYAYQNSAGRLMGFFPNEAEVAKANGHFSLLMRTLLKRGIGWERGGILSSSFTGVML